MSWFSNSAHPGPGPTTLRLRLTPIRSKWLRKLNIHGGLLSRLICLRHEKSLCGESQYFLDWLGDRAYRSRMSFTKRIFFARSSACFTSASMAGIGSLLLAAALNGCGPSEDTSSNASGTPTTSASSPVATSVTQKPASQAELAAGFDSSTDTIFEARTAADLMKLKPQQQLTVSAAPAGLKLSATGNDPKLILPPFIAGKRAILQVSITSPVATPIQLFYSLQDRPRLSEEQSQTVILKPGRNVVYFQLDQPQLIDPLWLDPAAAPGEYVIESIVARSKARSVAP